MGYEVGEVDGLLEGDFDGSYVGEIDVTEDGAFVGDTDFGLNEGGAVAGALTGDLFNYNYKQNFVVQGQKYQHIQVIRNGIHIVIHTMLDQWLVSWLDSMYRSLILHCMDILQYT